jgi:hypothetical protein
VSTLVYESTGSEHSKYVRHVGAGGGVSKNSVSRTKNMKNAKNSTKIDFFLFFFSIDNFFLKLIENTKNRL